MRGRFSGSGTHQYNDEHINHHVHKFQHQYNDDDFDNYLDFYIHVNDNFYVHY